MDGRGEDLSFGGKVMKNVAGYDVSRLIPGSLGTLALLLEASVKVLPKPAATASLRCVISQDRALRVLNEWAGQPLPLNASVWIGNPSDEGTLTVRLAGANAAVNTANQMMCTELNATLLIPRMQSLSGNNCVSKPLLGSRSSLRVMRFGDYHSQRIAKL